MPAPIPIGLVGGGKHGTRYLRHVIEDVPELRLALLCRRDSEAGREQAARAGARYVADFRELVVSPEIQAVVSVVPPTLNASIACLAAGAGKALLIEKPLAATVAQCREIREAVRAAAVPAMVAQTLRFSSVVQAVKRAIERVGPVHQVGLSQRFEPSRLAWLDDPAHAGGGIILHTGVHGFDLLRFLTGADPTHAFATATRVATSGTEDAFAAVFSFASPLVATVAGSRATASRSGAVEVSGARGQIVADHVHGRANLIEGLKTTPLDLAPEVPTVREALRAFARALHDDSPMPITLDDGLWAVAMAEACYASAASGRAMAIDRFG